MKFTSCKKIIKTKDGFLAGASGNITEMQEFLNWAATDRKTKPKFLEKGDCEAILIDPDGTIYYFDGSIPIECLDNSVAIGSGCQAAKGALYMKASAIEAVKAAIAVNKSCGGKVRSVKLK